MKIQKILKSKVTKNAGWLIGAFIIWRWRLSWAC